MKYISILIRQNAGPASSVLVCKRAGGGWELPCGTVRTGETEQEAAVRVAWEQLQMETAAGRLAMLGHKYPKDGFDEHILCGNITHNTHTKHNWHCYYESSAHWKAQPRPGIYDQFKWVRPSELDRCGLSGDDGQFAAKYQPWACGGEIPDVRML